MLPLCWLQEIEKLNKREIPKETSAFPPTPVRPHSLKAEHHERSFAPHPVSKHPSRDAWFDKPYEPSVRSTPITAVEPLVSRPKTQMPVLFMQRKPDNAA